MWAEFWIILLAVVLVIAAWCIYLIERQRRKERRERLAWKRKYYSLSCSTTRSDHEAS